MTEPIIPKTKREREAWMDGFICAAYAINGPTDQYQRFRDQYLAGRPLKKLARAIEFERITFHQTARVG